MGGLGDIDLILLIDDLDSLVVVCKECEYRVCIKDLL